MYISTFYGVLKQSNGYFKIFYPVYANGDINPVVNASEFNSFSTAHNQADLAYLDLQSALANVDNISVYGNYEFLYENNNYLIQQVVLEVNLTQSSDPDYTNILTSINTNLTNLNTNIQNKNNQSDIVSCLNNIFCYSSNDNSNISCIKDNVNNASSNKTYLNNANLTNMLRKLIRALSNYSFDYADVLSNNDKIFQDISKKLTFTTPTNQSDPNSIFRVLRVIAMSLSSSGGVNFGNDDNIVSNSSLKKISDKLANSNDLHTISQAIDLISTAIAQTPTTDTSNLEQGLTEIKESIENRDNVLLVDGTQNFVFRKEEDDPDQ